MEKGLIIIVSGPSGAGKGTVVASLTEAGGFGLSISATTRQPREGDAEGVNYFFKTRAEFEEMIAAGEFLEYAEYCGNYYGTPLPYVRQQTSEGKDVILEIEVQGALKVREKCPEAILIFLAPPSMEELEARLRGRKTDSEEAIAQRLEKARREIALADKYDYIVVNNKVEEAVKDIRSVIRAEHIYASDETRPFDMENVRSVLRAEQIKANKDIKNIIKGVE